MRLTPCFAPMTLVGAAAACAISARPASALPMSFGVSPRETSMATGWVDPALVMAAARMESNSEGACEAPDVGLCRRDAPWKLASSRLSAQSNTPSGRVEVVG